MVFDKHAPEFPMKGFPVINWAENVGASSAYCYYWVFTIGSLLLILKYYFNIFLFNFKIKSGREFQSLQYVFQCLILEFS